MTQQIVLLPEVLCKNAAIFFCQHYQESCSILFCDPLPPYQKSILIMLILIPLPSITKHCKRFFFENVKQALDSPVCAV